MNTKEKLKHHFGNKPVVWVPAWGISKLRKRAGRFAGAITGEALWFDEWYDRVMSRETVQKFAELGVNMVILPFSLGGNEIIEKDERDDFERMTSLLHEEGITSLPYIQYQNIFQEEVELKNTEWAERIDGSWAGFTYWRRTVCQSTPGFKKYLKELISDGIKRGADGVWIDNTYLHPCRCSSCITMFREYLSRNRQNLLEELFLTSFERIDIPPFIQDATDDPIIQAYIEFNCERNMDIIGELKSHLEKESDVGLFASNPAIFRGSSHSFRGIDLYEMEKQHDVLYLENHLFPSVENEQIIGNYHGFTSLNRCSTLAIPGTWKTTADPDATTGSEKLELPGTVNEIARLLYEPSTFNQATGMVWAVRSRDYANSTCPEDLLQMYFETPHIHDAMKKATNFINSLPFGRERHNLAEVAVLFHRESLMFNNIKSDSSLYCIQELLIKLRLPYNVIFSEEIDAVSDFQMIILPDATLMSEKEGEILRKYVKNGGKILAIGLAGICDERKRPRPDLLIADVLGAGIFSCNSEEVIYNQYGAGKTAYIPSSTLKEEKIVGMFINSDVRLTEWAKQSGIIETAINNLLNNQPQVRLEAEGNVTVTISKTSNNRVVLQILSYDEDPITQECRIRVRSDLLKKSIATWLVPDNEELKIKGEQEEDNTFFKLPAFSVYGVLVI